MSEQHNPEDQELMEHTDIPEDDCPPVRGVGFWLSLVGVLVLGLVGGVALSTYLVPTGLLPGDPHLPAEVVATERADLEAEITLGIEEADAESDDFELAMEDIIPALIYTVREPNLNTCVDYIGFDAEGLLRTVRMTAVYDC
jgi:hypothetical protein